MLTLLFFSFPMPRCIADLPMQTSSSMAFIADLYISVWHMIWQKKNNLLTTIFKKCMIQEKIRKTTGGSEIFWPKWIEWWVLKFSVMYLLFVCTGFHLIKEEIHYIPPTELQLPGFKEIYLTWALLGDKCVLFLNVTVTDKCTLESVKKISLQLAMH